MRLSAGPAWCACAGRLDEVGYGALTTRAVAVRAGVPIGSVHRFFGTRRQMADALGRRNLDTLLFCAYCSCVNGLLRSVGGT